MRPLLLACLLCVLAAPAAAEPIQISPPPQAHQREQAPASWPAPPPVVYRPAPPLPRNQPIADPARTRLVFNSTGDLLHAGELEFVCRELLGVQLAFGISDWLELGITSTPLLAMLPPIGLQDSYWSGDLRLQLIRSELVSLAAELSGLSFIGYAGLRAGLALRLGNDRLAFHGNASASRLWSTEDDDPYCPINVGCESDDDSQAFLLASGGMTLRVARKVKLLFEALYYRDNGMDALLASPAVRLHGHHFAADLGLLFVRTGGSDETYVLPLVNLSLNY